MDTPPHPFEAAASLAADPIPASRARTLRAALDKVPELQAWLREARRRAIQEMVDEGMSYRGIGKEFGISAARVQQILEGRSSGHHAANTDRPAPPSEDDRAADGVLAD